MFSFYLRSPILFRSRLWLRGTPDTFCGTRVVVWWRLLLACGCSSRPLWVTHPTTQIKLQPFGNTLRAYSIRCCSSCQKLIIDVIILLLARSVGVSHDALATKFPVRSLANGALIPLPCTYEALSLLLCKYHIVVPCAVAFVSYAARKVAREYTVGTLCVFWTR